MECVNRAVLCNRPHRIAAHIYVAVTVAAVAGPGLIIDEVTGKSAAICKIEIEGADAVIYDLAGDILGVAGKGALGTICTCTAPAALIGVAGHLQEEIVVL